MLLTIESTEVVDVVEKAGQNLQEMAENPGIIRTYFENLVPDLIGFALQVILAILVYVVGTKVIRLIVKLV